MNITLVACLDMNFGIGNEEGELLYNIPKDMKNFKAITTGKVVVMGRKTWDSLPKKPLPKRKNYVLTRDKEFSHIGAKVIHSIEDVLKLAKTNEVMVIGGGNVYEQLLPYANRMILTHVHEVNIEARVFFPQYEDKEWTPTSLVKHEATGGFPSFTFATYVRK